MKGYWILKGLKIAVFVAAAVALFGVAVMWLWNWLVPDIFGIGEITWIQALGLLLLARILVGGRGWGGGHCRGGGHHHHWRAKWEAKWERMSPEQRARFREHWDRKCGSKHMPWEPKGETSPAPETKSEQ